MEYIRKHVGHEHEPFRHSAPPLPRRRDRHVFELEHVGVSAEARGGFLLHHIGPQVESPTPRPLRTRIVKIDPQPVDGVRG